jgi:flagellar hook-associated protein 3 FlgL
MQDNMAKIYEAQRALTTGKRIQKPSDDPAAMTRIQSGKTMEGRLTQYQRNISTASGYL